MADINQVRSEVNGACSRYKQEIQQIVQLENNWNSVNNSWHAANRNYENAKNELEIKKAEAQSLLADIERRQSDEDGGNNSFAQYQLQMIRSEIVQLQERCQECEQERRRLAAQLRDIENRLNSLKQAHAECQNYLEQVKLQMNNAAEFFQNKLMGYNQTIGILNGASGNQFGGAAPSAASNLGNTQTQLQENLKIAQDVIEQIESTLSSGDGDVKVLRRY